MIIIDTPHFYAGIIIKKGIVTDTAPIVNYMKGWDVHRVKSYCLYKGWSIKEVKNV